MQATDYCAIRSCIYGHILALNLHSMWTAHLAKTPLLFWFLTYCVHLPSFLRSSWFLPSAQLSVFCFLTKQVALFLHMFFCVYFYQYRFHFQNESTAPFHGMVLVRLQLVFFFAYILSSPSSTVAFCSAIRFTAYLFRFGFQFSILPGAGTSIGWLQQSAFQAVDGDLFGVATGLMVLASAAIPP